MLAFVLLFIIAIEIVLRSLGLLLSTICAHSLLYITIRHRSLQLVIVPHRLLLGLSLIPFAYK